ncbi:MAG: ferric reductase-like transmembrane domain-containing protein [Actinobacteria bacterium]|nr:ferric reductase-like transmembrane domain-containing protein [Actinomycetota bacterium]
MTNSHFWWYLSRASGIVSWALLTATILWGIFLATRIFKPFDRPAWLLDLHRWLGALTIFGVALHLVALFADSYVEFSVADLVVPFMSSWRPVALALGVVAMYLLVIVQVSSLMIKKLPKKIWRAIHFLSYPMFLFVMLHSFLAGSDRGQALFFSFAAILVFFTGISTIQRVKYKLNPKQKALFQS